ncbi:MAG: hypothetical protein QM576_07030 [Rhodopseudomonas sp.]|uniref:hypothetical protein n=1 Tax=Rhodopseudomonas sp. TaxID=1078 RepID=UPI0039E317A0
MSPEVVVLGSAVAIPLSIVALGIIGAKLLVRRGLARRAAFAVTRTEADFGAAPHRALSRAQDSFGTEATRIAKANAASAPAPLSAAALASISEALSVAKESNFLQAEADLQAALLSARAADELQLRDLERRLRKLKSLIAASEASAGQAKSEDQPAEDDASRTQTRP